MANLIPGGQILGVVGMGLELAKGLFDKGDMQGTQDMLKFLNEVVSKLGQPGGQACEPLPFTNPQLPGMQNMVNAQTLNNPEFMKNARRSVDITVDVQGGQVSNQPIHYGTLPTVDGSAAGDQQLSQAASARIDGNAGNKGRALTPGSQEWTTVMWAMQQNPNVRYNADTQQFTLKMTDGTDRQLCSLADAQKAAGNADRGNPAGAAKLGDYLSQCSNAVQQSGDLQNLVQELKKLLQQFEEAQQMMQKSTIDISITHAVA